MPLAKIPWEDADSSNLNGTYFDERTQTICVRFQNGMFYTYRGGDMEMYMALTHAESMGRYLHYVLKALQYNRWHSEHELLNYLNS
jgi:hypothetical protein